MIVGNTLVGLELGEKLLLTAEQLLEILEAAQVLQTASQTASLEQSSAPATKLF